MYVLLYDSKDNDYAILNLRKQTWLCQNTNSGTWVTFDKIKNLKVHSDDYTFEEDADYTSLRQYLTDMAEYYPYLRFLMFPTLKSLYKAKSTHPEFFL